MARPPSENPTDDTLRIRTHKAFLTRLKRVSKKNGRSQAGEALFAIRNHVDAEEKRLGLPPIIETQDQAQQQQQGRSIVVFENAGQARSHFAKQDLARAAEDPPSPPAEKKAAGGTS